MSETLSIVSNWTWTDDVLDNFIAPEMSKLTQGSAEELSGNIYLLSHFMLNSLLRANFPSKERAFFVNYIRRVEQSIQEYKAGREALLRLLAERNQRPRLYFPALHHFEQCVALVYQAGVLGTTYLRTIGASERLFTKSDGSAWERLNIVYNGWKHGDERLERGELPANGTVPVWMVNDGLKCEKALLLFSELRDILVESEKSAKWLAEDLPNAIVERSKAATNAPPPAPVPAAPAP